MKMLLAAKYYTSLGFSVIPTSPQTKRPYWNKLPKKIKDGRSVGVWRPFQKRIADEAMLKKWFVNDCANVSIVTGAVSGTLVVLDFDHEAAKIFPEWVGEVGSLSEKLPVVKTGKGMHVYVRFPFEMPNQKLAYAENGQVRIETRGEGGYVQAPPSLHNSGVTYTWVQHCPSVIPKLSRPAAKYLLEVSLLFNQRVKPKRKRVNTAVRSIPVDDAEVTRRLRQYAQAAMRNEVNTLGRVVEGSRNDELNKAAFRLGRYVGCGLLQAEEVCSLLHEACLQNGAIQDDGQPAFDKTVRSGLNAGMKVQDFWPQIQARVMGAEPATILQNSKREQRVIDRS